MILFLLFNSIVLVYSQTVKTQEENNEQTKENKTDQLKQSTNVSENHYIVTTPISSANEIDKVSYADRLNTLEDKERMILPSEAKKPK